MATRTWIGGTSGDWFEPTSWDPNGVPQAGDEVVIADGGPTIPSSDLQPLDNLHVRLGGIDFAQPASISASGPTFGSAFAVTVLPNSPYAALSFDDSTTFNGTVTVVGGQLSVTIDTELQGSGQTFIEKGATVTFNGAMPSTHTVSFRDPNGTLVLTNPTDFAARITGVQPGDRIELGHLYIAVSTSYADGKLTITGEGGAVIATLNLVEEVSPMNFYASLSGNGASTLSTSRRNCSWNGGTGDWYDATLWAGGVPLGGDTVLIPGGTVLLNEADASTYGTLDAESIILGTAGSSEAVVLKMTNASLGPAAFIRTRGNPQYAPEYIQPQVTLLASGTTRFDATIFHEASGGKLAIASSGNFIITGNPPASAQNDKAPFATIFVGQESRLEFTAGTFTNNGLVLIDGNAEIAQGVVFQGAGSIEMEGGGSVSVLGAVSAEQSFVFSDDKGTLSIGNLLEFKAKVEVARGGNKIRLPNLPAQSLSYNKEKEVLVLNDVDGIPLGEVRITDPDGYGTKDFTLKSEGKGSAITYTPQGAVTLTVSLPAAAVGKTGALIPMKTLLKRAFGGVPIHYASYNLSGPFRRWLNESYWEQPQLGGTPTNSRWHYDNRPITRPMTVPASDLDLVVLYVGNSIVRTAYFSVPVAFDDAGNPTEFVQYNIWTVDPSVDAPETAYHTPDPNLPGSARRFGRPDPSDIVSSAYRYNTVYSGVLNYNNCNWISDNVTAGAGAVQPYDNASTDPANNVSGGFWRIVYRGSDSPEPVRDWFTLTQPGDVVRMGRLDENGMHTTTVVGTINPNGSIAVYDNGDKKPGKENMIGAHEATYWTGTDPATITIYRLDPKHQYLIEGTGQSEFIQGSVFNNLIRPGGGRDTIAAGAGHNEIQDITAHLDGITVTDFHAHDTLNFTDLSDSKVTTAFANGVLIVLQNGVAVARINLPGLALGAAFATAPNGQGGTIVCLASTVKSLTKGSPF